MDPETWRIVKELDPDEVLAVARDPEKLEAVQAELCMAVYTARRRARLQFLGREPIPPASAAALKLWRRAKSEEVPA